MAAGISLNSFAYRMRSTRKLISYGLLAMFLLACSAEEGKSQIFEKITEWGFFPESIGPRTSGLYAQLGTDYFRRRQADVHSTAVLTLFYRTDAGFFMGNSLHSGAFGQGGGIFLGGIELGWIFPFVKNSELSVSGFIGGGGGAGQVPGEGMMLRTNASLLLPVFDRTYVAGGLSRIHITGSPISTYAAHLSIQRQLNLAIAPGHNRNMNVLRGATVVRAFKPAARVYIPLGSKKRRSTEPLGNMYGMGTEVGFELHPHGEAFVQAYGVFAGDAEGYADWALGYRHFFDMDFGRVFVAAASGSAGGGAVNSGGGLFMLAGAGVEIPAFSRFAVEVEMNAVRALNGDFLALAPGVKFVSLLEREGREDRRFTYGWRAHNGIAIQIPNKHYRVPGASSKKAPIMIEAKLDLFLKEQLYVTGHGYTAFKGDAGGYQLGLLGVGYTQPVYKRVMASGEVYLGAGGGAGIQTRGGLVSGARVDFDVPIVGYLSWSVGVGKIFALMGKGMAPWTLHTGITLPFLSFH